MTAHTLVFHGAIILFIGMLLGFPLAKKLATKNARDSGHEPWRMAHTAICAAGAAMIALAGAFHLVQLSQAFATIFVGSITTSAYAFTVGVTTAGISGYRGLRLEGPALNWFVMSCNIIGVIGSLIAGVLLIVGTI